MCSRKGRGDATVAPTRWEDPLVDHLQIEGFVAPGECEALAEAMRRAEGAPAGLIGAGEARPVWSQVRRTTEVAVPAETARALADRIGAARPRLESRFGAPLGACEPPQFLRYGPGDYFVAHQDGNTALLPDRSRLRRVSLVLFVSGPEDYAGGGLVLHEAFPGAGRLPLRPAAGTLVAFRAETTHEVAPVTKGRRLTVAAWMRAAEPTASPGP